MSFLSRLFGGDESGDIQEIADEIDRYADRFENSDDAENAALARGYAGRVRQVKTYKEAKVLKTEFLAIIEKFEAGATRDDRGYDRTYHDRDNGERDSDDS